MSSRSKMLRRTMLVTATLLGMSAPPAFAGKAHLAGLQTRNPSERVFDQFIVTYRSGSMERKDASVINRGLARAAQAVPASRNKVQGGKGGSPTSGMSVKHFRRMSLGADVIRVDRRLDRVDAESLMRQIAADPNVVSVEVDGWKFPALTPNDPKYVDQWHYKATSVGISLPAAWDVTTGSGMVVAVLDTGSTPHSDLNANTVAGYDFISSSTTAQDGGGRDSNPNDPGDGYTNYACGQNKNESENSSWHGTHVAGTIAAVTNNGKGVAGVAYGAKIQHGRVLGRCGGRDSDIADAVVWASGGAVSGVPANATPAKVINLSLGGPGSCSSVFQNAINSARSRGAVLVVAAGNSANPVSENTPANCSGVIAVGATNSSGGRSIFNGGDESSHGSGVDIAAPGSGIWSTLNSGSLGQGSESYASYSGTSMATPHVAGVVALVQSTRNALGVPLWTPTEVEAKLKETAKPFPVSIDKPIGAGILNAAAAVAAAGGGTTPPPPPSGNVLSNGVPVNGLSANSGTTLTYTLSVPAGATNLRITTAGGSGDADLEVLLGTSRPCPISEGSSNAESCSVTNPAAGTYTVKVIAYSTFSGLTLTGSYTASGGGGGTTCPAIGSTVPSYSVWQCHVKAALAGSQDWLQQRKSQGGSNLAIVLDIDNTAIDSNVAGSGTYDDVANPPVLELARWAKSNGYSILFVTRRSGSSSTRTQLLNAGYAVDALCGTSTASSKEECRRMLTEQGYTITANIGNKSTDFTGGDYEKAYRLPDYNGQLQ